MAKTDLEHDNNNVFILLLYFHSYHILYKITIFTILKLVESYIRNMMTTITKI